MSVLNEFAFVIDATLYNFSGLIFVVLGVFVLIRVSGYPDLTIDGSFTIGAVLYSVTAYTSSSALLALFIAVLGGAAAGALTWAINVKLGIGKVISSVLSMIILILLAPYISGGSSRSLLNSESGFAMISSLDEKISRYLLPDVSFQLHLVFNTVCMLLLGVILFGLAVFFRSKIGLKLRYIGGAEQPNLVNDKSRYYLLALGLVLGNGLVALGGAIEAERRAGYTNNMGVGTILIGLTVLILGESIVKARTNSRFLTVNGYFTGLVLGTLIYAFGIQIILQMGFNFVDLRLLSAIFLLVILAMANRKNSSSNELF